MAISAKGRGQVLALQARPPEASGGVPLGYSWAIGPLDGDFWGLAHGDVDGDGSAESLLLERSRVRIGRLNSKGFDQLASCGWAGPAQGARVYALDLNGDGDDEIIISAVEEGLPASLVLDYEKGSCRQLVSRARLSLRVIEIPEPSESKVDETRELPARRTATRKALVGQGWSSDSFFFGPIYELKLSGKRFSRQKKLRLPRRTELYQFTMLPPRQGTPSLMKMKGYKRLGVSELKGKRFRGVWRSGQRFGGSLNLLPAEQREVLGQEDAETVIFDLPPLIIDRPKDYQVIALRHDMPLKGFVGRQPYIRGGELVVFRPDPVLTFTEVMRTVRLPGAVVDYYVDSANKKGKQRLLVLMQEKPGFFHKTTRSLILAFDLP
jgi:hypothetical protein